MRGWRALLGSQKASSDPKETGPSFFDLINGETANDRHRTTTPSRRRKKKLADDKTAREKASKDSAKAAAETKPTPTQEENDLAASGVPVAEHEDDGSGPDPNVPARKRKATTSKSRQTDAEGRLRDANATAVSVRGFPDSVAGRIVGKGEGDYRPGPYYLPVTGGWLPDGVPDNWWQLGYTPIRGRSLGDGRGLRLGLFANRRHVPGLALATQRQQRARARENSALSRLLRHPNDYQSISDFLLNATRQLYLTGNAYALALRNSRFEIDELHLMNADLCYPRVAL